MSEGPDAASGGVQRPGVVAHRGEDLAQVVEEPQAAATPSPALDAQERVGAAGDVERVRAVGAAAAGRAAGRGHRVREVRREADLHGGRAGGRRSQEQQGEWAPHPNGLGAACIEAVLASLPICACPGAAPASKLSRSVVRAGPVPRRSKLSNHALSCGSARGRLVRGRLSVV